MTHLMIMSFYGFIDLLLVRRRRKEQGNAIELEVLIGESQPWIH